MHTVSATSDLTLFCQINDAYPSTVSAANIMFVMSKVKMQTRSRKCVFPRRFFLMRLESIIQCLMIRLLYSYHNIMPLRNTVWAKKLHTELMAIIVPDLNRYF